MSQRALHDSDYSARTAIAVELLAMLKAAKKKTKHEKPDRLKPRKASA